MAEPDPVVEPGDSATAAQSGEGLLGDGPDDGDPVALALARARVGAALFGDDGGEPIAHVARFRVLERLGQGGMGVVYTAYDPELDRAVALKLVRVREGREEAALDEAKALARLSHPNVVPVHDVGILDRHVYIVMELVRGETLAAWASAPERTTKELLRAYREAGAALEAAHEAGLVHRDFKPDNALVGRDGRVRVVDFGLACAAAEPGQPDRAVRAAGTPAYMAPEQAAGRAPTPAADQYSFCTALLEAFTARGAGRKSSTPRWIEAVLARGRAAEPADRYPSMGELLRALAHDPTRAWLTRSAVAVVAAVIVVAFVVGRSLRDPDGGVCGGGEASIASAWAPAARGDVIARVAGLGDYGRSASSRLDASLGAWESRWAVQHREACQSHRRGEQSDQLLDRRMACLEQVRVAFATVVETARTAAAEGVPRLVTAAGSMPDPGRCGDLDALVAEPLPRQEIAAAITALRSQLERARTLMIAGRPDDATREAITAVARAREIGERRWIAEALLIQGQTRVLEDPDAVVAPLGEATALALATGADAVAVEAWARRAYALAVTDHAAAALAGHELIEALATRSTATPYARTQLYNCLGGVAAASDRNADARASWARAVEEARALGPSDAALAASARLSFAISDPTRTDALLAEVIEDQTRVLGADHPDTLESIVIRGVLSADPGRAEATLGPACERLAALHPTQSRHIESCWSELGYVAMTLGDRDRAILAFGRAAALHETAHVGDALSAAYLALVRGDARQAATRFQAEIKEAPKPGDATWVRRPFADAEVGLGEALRVLGSPEEARPHLARAVAIFTDIAAEHPNVVFDRGLARARAQLALAQK